MKDTRARCSLGKRKVAETGARGEGCALKGHSSGPEGTRHHNRRPFKISGHT